MKKKIFSSLILTVLVCSIFVGLFQQAALGSKVTFVACKGIDKSQKRWAPIDVTNSFEATDEKIYLFIEIEDVKGPLRVTIKAIDPQGEVFYQAPTDFKEGSYDWIQTFIWLNVAEVLLVNGAQKLTRMMS